MTAPYLILLVVVVVNKSSNDCPLNTCSEIVTFECVDDDVPSQCCPLVIYLGIFKAGRINIIRKHEEWTLGTHLF